MSFVRFLLVLASVVAPWMIWAYGVAALLIPAEGRKRPDWDNLIGVARLGVLIGIPELVSPEPFYIDDPTGGSAGWWFAKLALLGVGTLALMSADYRRGGPRSPAESRSAVLACVPVAGCAALLALGALLAPDLRWERFVPVAAVVGGATLIASTHRRDFVAPAILALAVSALIVGAGSRLEGGAGHLQLKPSEQSSGPIVARRAVGSVTIDLRRLARSADPVTVHASVGIGSIEVTVPRGARVEVVVRVGQGNIDPLLAGLDHSRLQGYDQQLERVYQAPGRHGPARVRLVADVGLGSIEIDGPRRGFGAVGGQP